jgi:L-asparaginase / beta-aspartyl-peptidase
MSAAGERWALVLHGGAKEIAPEKEAANRRGCAKALAVGRRVLSGGGSAVEAVEATIRILEDDSTFNAGFGSARNSDGDVEMDAALMDGTGLELGAVAAIRNVRHPITVARLLLPEPPTLLVADGALRFALERDAELRDSGDALRTVGKSAEGQRVRDTVGCVALDVEGHVAAGTSTGGLDGNMPGRIGDSSVPGCGLYADDLVGGVSLSGDGEMISRTILAAHIMRVLESSDPQQAAEQGLERLARVGGEAGAIVLDRLGRIGWAHNSKHFAVACATSTSAQSDTFLSRRELKDQAA